MDNTYWNDTEDYPDYPYVNDAVANPPPQLQTAYDWNFIALRTEDGQSSDSSASPLTALSLYTPIDTSETLLPILYDHLPQEYQSSNSENASISVGIVDDTTAPSECVGDHQAVQHLPQADGPEQWLEWSKQQGIEVPSPGVETSQSRGYEETKESQDLRAEVEIYIEITKERRKIFKCIICPARRLQGEVEPETAKEKKKVTEMSTKMHALDHIYTEHFGHRLSFRFKCVECEFRSMSESSTQKHYRTAHAEGKYECPNCGALGRKDYILGKHAKAHCQGRNAADSRSSSTSQEGLPCNELKYTHT